MDERRYNVIFKGEIHEQATLSLVQERLASFFKVDVEKIKIMFSKKRTIVKKNASYELCQKVEQGFLNSGAYVDFEEVFPEGYEPEVVAPGPPPGYVPDPEPEDSPESEYAPDSDYEVEPEQEYAPEAEYESTPEPEAVEPEHELKDVSAPKYDGADPAMPESVLQQPLSMEDESNKFEEVEPDSEEYEDEPTLGYAPMPEYVDEVKEEHEVEVESEIEPEPEFEIVEDEPDDESEETSEPEFEIKGAESEIEVEPEIEPDPEYEFDDIEELDVSVDNFNSFEMENTELLSKASSENPYATPHAKLEQDDLSQKSNFVAPQKLPVKNGLNWLIAGFTLFKKNPFKWITSVFVFFFVTVVASLIPILGAIATNLFNPVFMAGFMIGAKEQTEGGNYRIGAVFAGFSNNAGQLILFGLLYSVVTLAIFGLMAIVGVVVFIVMTSGSMNFSDPATFAAFSNMSPLILILIILSAMLITLPIMMAYYFGPALISINQASVFNAVKMSFRACLSNILPFLMYGLGCIGIFIAVALILGGFSALLGMLFDDIGLYIGFGGMFIVMFAITPVFFASTYVAYKDIFYIK
jgi:hypothetical protein